MEISGGEGIKWATGITAGIVAFFTLKSRLVAEIEAKLKLRIDLINSETALVIERNEQLKLEIVRVEALVELKLSEKEHELMCGTMHLQIQSLEECIKREFEIIHGRMDKRRKTNGAQEIKS